MPADFGSNMVIQRDLNAETSDFSNGYEQFEKTNKLRDSMVDHLFVEINQKVFAPKYADQDWETMSIPCKWSDYGIKNYYGYVWFRKHIELAGTSILKVLILNLGDVSNENIACFNGIEINKINIGTNVSYKIPANLVIPGDSMISLRVLGRWAVCGFNSPTIDRT